MQEKAHEPCGAIKISVSFEKGQLTVSGLVRTPKNSRMLRRLRRLILVTLFGGGAALLGSEHASAGLHLCQIGLSAACGYAALWMR